MVQSTPWRRKVRGLARKKEPDTSRYGMRCYVAAGSALPQSPSVVRMGKNYHMAVRISIGGEYLETQMVDNHGGVCEVSYCSALNSRRRFAPERFHCCHPRRAYD